MSLRDFRALKEPLAIPGGEITIRGLSLSDITAIAAVNAPALANLFSEITAASKADEDTVDFKSIALKAVQASEALPGWIIAYAADEPDMIEAANDLPFPVQLKALERIVALTFSGDDGLKSFAETVIRVATAVTGSVTMLTSPNPSPSLSMDGDTASTSP